MSVLRARAVLFFFALGCSKGGAVVSPPTGTGGDAGASGGASGSGGNANTNPDAPAATTVDAAKDAAQIDVPAVDSEPAHSDVGNPGPGDSAPPAGEPKREAFLAQLRKLVNPMPPLAPMLMTATNNNGVTVQDFSFASTPTWRVPGTLRRPTAAAGRLPVAIVLHETGADRTSGNVVGIANALVARGFLAVAITGRYCVGGGTAAYVKAMKDAAANPGRDYPFLYDTAWDTMRLIDYLVTRDDVDPARIGLTGISKGGMETLLVAAVDPRVAAAAPLIGVQSFKWGLENNAFQARALSLEDAVPDPNNAASVRMFYDRVAPGLVDQFDGPDMLPLVAPRALIVIAGLQDPRNPLGGLTLTMNAATPVYARAGAADKLKLFTADVGHDGGYAPFHQAAVDWLDRWLGKAAPP
ncbi:MAG: hypothetical protein QOI66_3523 [Myxococcales bacterium]|nr:hypothetical protein [Myxococcales bacterium]